MKEENINVEEILGKEDVFIYRNGTSKKDTEDMNIVIDFTSILSMFTNRKKFVKNDKYQETLYVKYNNSDTKAHYIFEDKSEMERFWTEYKAFLGKRKSLDYISKNVLNELMLSVREEFDASNKKIIEDNLLCMKKAFSEEINKFKETIGIEADKIVSTALNHQVEINNKNNELLKVVTEMTSESSSVLNTFEMFSSQINGLVDAIKHLTPPDSKDDEVKQSELKEYNKETES